MPADQNTAETTAETTAATVEVGPQFRIGAVIGRGFSILFRNIVPFGLLALIVYSPYIVLIALGLDSSTGFEEDSGLFIAIALAAGFGYMLLYFLLNAAVVYGTVQDLRGGKATLGACLGRGLSTIFPVIGAGVLVWLVTALGAIVFVIPGIIAMVMLWVAIPVAVTERKGPVESLSRSSELTKGNRWGIFGIIFLVGILNAVVGTVIQLGLGAASGEASMAAVVLSTLSEIFFALLFAVISAVAYHDLRAAKEGTDIEQIAAVFD